MKGKGFALKSHMQGAHEVGGKGFALKSHTKGIREVEEKGKGFAGKVKLKDIANFWYDNIHDLR